MLIARFNSTDIATEVGKIGAFIAVAAVVLLILRWNHKRNPRTNPWCVYSLTMILLVFLVSDIMMLFGIDWSNRALALVPALFVMVFFIAAAVLAIVGLVQCKLNPERNKGWVRAIVVLAIFLLYLIAAVIIVIIGVRKAILSTSAGEATTLATSAGEDLVYEDFNLRFHSPGKPYVLIDFKKINPAATFGLMRSNPQVMFFVVAEKAVGFDLSTPGLTEISKGYLRSNTEGASISDDIPRRINGLDGILFYSDVRIKGFPLTYVHWVVAHNGYCYQFVTYGSQSQREEVRREAEMLLQRFELIDPARQAGGTGATLFGSFTSPFGYTVDLQGTAWTKWDNVAQNTPRAEVGGKHGPAICFLIAPFFYGSEQPPPEALNKALLTVLNIDPQKKELTGARPTSEAGMTGQTFTYSRTTDGILFGFRLKILMRDGCAYLLAVWGRKDDKAVDARAAEVFAGVHFQMDQPVLVSPTQFTEPQRVAQALLQNGVGLFFYHNKQYDKAAGYFRRAAETNPRDKDFTTNLLNTLFYLHQNEAALAFLDEHGGAVADLQTVRSWKAQHLKALGRAEEAAAVYAKLFAEGMSDDDDFSTYIDLLASAQWWDEAHAAFDAYLKNHDSPALRLAQANLLHRQGKHAEAIAMLKSLQKDKDYNVDIAYALITNYNSLEQPKESLAVCEEMIAKGLGSADAYYLKGRAESDLKWYNKAKESYTKALELSPKDEGLSRALRDVSAMLGEGDNSSIRTSLEPVPLPRVLADQLPPVTAAAKEGYGAFYLSRIIGYSFVRGKELRYTVYTRIKVFDEGGVSRFSTMQMDFDPLTEELFVNELLVRDAAGQVVSRGQLADYYVVDRQQGSVASHDRTLFLPVPHLQPGHTIELTLTRLERGKPEEFYYQNSALRTVRPILLSAVYYLGDLKDIRHKSVRAPQPEPIDGGLLWCMKDVPAFRWESMQPDFEKLAPMVYLADARSSWEAVAAHLLEKIRDKLVLDDKMRQLAQDLTRQADSRQAKIEALARYVQSTCTYKAIEFGRRAQIPNTAEQTLARKYGDCKDHAVLFQQLLAAAGIPSHLVLVGGSALQDDLPSLDQFNHMIVYVPDEKGGRFIDTTDKGLDPSALVPYGLGGRVALVLDPAHPHLATIPPFGDDASSAQVDRAVEVLPDRTLGVRETVTLKGLVASAMRDHLKGMDPAKHTDWAQSLASRYLKSAKVKSFNAAGLYDTSKPLTLEMVLEIKDGARKADNDLVIRLPDDWERNYLAVEQMKREESFEIFVPFVFQSTTSVALPPGHGMAPITLAPDKGEGPGGRWQASLSSKPGACILKMTCKLTLGTFGAEQYPPFYNLMEEAIVSVAREIRYRPAP
jgi:tetratricopeptide (TPR) repeat protein/NADH:ubiquinone oxidoreductase subunit 6 (subunit J)